MIILPRLNSYVSLFLPDNPFPRYEPVAGIAKISLGAFGTDLEFFTTLRAERIHVKFVVGAVPVAARAEKPCPVRSKFLHHFRAAFMTYSSYHNFHPSKPILVKLGQVT
jgi:hypothetical protein